MIDRGSGFLALIGMELLIRRSQDWARDDDLLVGFCKMSIYKKPTLPGSREKRAGTLAGCFLPSGNGLCSEELAA